MGYTAQTRLWFLLQAVFLGLHTNMIRAGVIRFDGSHGDIFWSDMNQDGTADAANLDGTNLLRGEGTN